MAWISQSFFAFHKARSERNQMLELQQISTEPFQGEQGRPCAERSQGIVWAKKQAATTQEDTMPVHCFSSKRPHGADERPSVPIVSIATIITTGAWVVSSTRSSTS